MFVLLIILLFTCAFIKIYFLLKKRNNYWNDRGVTQVKTNFLFGTSYDILFGKRSLEQIYEEIHRASDEPYIGAHDGSKPILILRDPELIHQITVKDFNYFHERQKTFKAVGRLAKSVPVLDGDEWKITRNKLVVAFSGSKMKRMYNLIEECTNMLVQYHFRPFAETREPMEVKEIVARFSLDVLGKCAFGLQFNSMNESDSLYRRIGKAFTNYTGLKNKFRLVISLMNPNLLPYFGMKMTTDEVENFFVDLLHGAEELRRQETDHRCDFLQLMLDIRDGDTDAAKYLFTEDHIASNMFIFYLAGHETTSLTIAFVLYELAMHPEMQEKLRHEISKVQKANNGLLDYQTIKKIAYLDMVIDETLRLHSPATVGTRVCTENYQLPGSSLVVKKDEMVFYSMSGIHKDEKYFPNPMKFDPERFSPENLPQMNPHAYMPWGSGPRICLGLRFAKLEVKICVATVISHFKLTRCSETEDPIVLKKKNSIFHAPENGIWLSVEEI